MLGLGCLVNGGWGDEDYLEGIEGLGELNYDKIGEKIFD